ncbi:MAG TPA: TolC family protein [Candidatus Acidoferrales bacterium]|nr:TolC family protein [Candidatus Acidoferrales bacterium]
MAASFRRVSVLLLLIVHGSFPLSSSGQQPSAGSTGSLKLTLKEALQLALKQNPQRIIARLLVSESNRNSQIARAALLPQANMAASGSVNQYNFQSIERSKQRTDAGPFQVIEAGPAFSQTLLNLPLIREYQIGREGTRQARADNKVRVRRWLPRWWTNTCWSCERWQRATPRMHVSFLHNGSTNKLPSFRKQGSD